jgi:hypothetical protein
MLAGKSEALHRWGAPQMSLSTDEAVNAPVFLELKKITPDALQEWNNFGSVPSALTLVIPSTYSRQGLFPLVLL